QAGNATAARPAKAARPSSRSPVMVRPKSVPSGAGQALPQTSRTAQSRHDHSDKDRTRSPRNLAATGAASAGDAMWGRERPVNPILRSEAPLNTISIVRLVLAYSLSRYSPTALTDAEGGSAKGRHSISAA